MSPTLLNIALDYIRSRVMESKEGIQVGARSLKDTEYAYDAALLAETLMAVVASTNYLTTKIMAVTRKF